MQEQCSHSNVALTFLSDLKLHSLGVWVGVGPVPGQQPGFPVFHSTADEYNSGFANADQNIFHGPQPQKHKPSELLRNGLKLAPTFYSCLSH